MPAPLSADRRVDKALRQILERALPGVRGLLDPYRPRLIFLGGSAALGEAVGWDTGAGHPLLLSDLDLSVVTDDPVPAAIRAEVDRWCRAPDGPGAGYAGGADVVTVGTYAASSLGGETPTPGVYDFARHGRVLWGDGRLLGHFLPGRLAEIEPAGIGFYEGVRLVGNRSLELLRVSPPPHQGGGRELLALDRARAFFTLAKACAGLWTASLIFEGRYVAGWGRRAALLDAPAGDAAAESTPEIREAALLWGAFLRAPSEATLPQAGKRLSSFRDGLAAWFDLLVRRSAGPWIEAFLAEPNTVRQWARAWRRPSPPRPGRSRLAAALRRGTGDTPSARRRAAAALYWWVLPEDPDPGWDGAAAGAWPEAESASAIRALPETDRPSTRRAGPEVEWAVAIRQLLGIDVAPGDGCRQRLARLLAETMDGSSAGA